ncbi:hypothetical protein IMG5_053500 [Ichthyophthirius multifiliis]|uniref:Uncharacterized protein n=1 Tax=Ichthyophthirius multifiliis TaxID=5932 RepID=G0QMY0_ICHMU|nr:hypothetical protein IMG5_053500 [Ichthyophthirius multifiliis]EGR33425.1 hypothetical protein IMG5_053500 [Ichthyophthirius multifiliis]|eukprot:XP_004037411.1 hypothetical protein IMG5_053500 [Ichthyophthirius multifiliis]
MPDDDSFILEGTVKRKKHQDLKDPSQVYSGSSFGGDLAFTCGVSYILASIFGLTKGVAEGLPENYKLPKKLLLNNFFNSLGKNQSNFGQKAAGAGIQYFQQKILLKNKVFYIIVLVILLTFYLKMNQIFLMICIKICQLELLQELYLPQVVVVLLLLEEVPLVLELLEVQHFYHNFYIKNNF